MHTSTRARIVTALTLVAPAASGQTELAPLPSAGAYVAAEPTSQPQPTHPNNSAARQREGWVTVSFIVATSGEVRDPLIEESIGIEGFADAALEAVRGWRYQAATIDGKPVEHSVTRLPIYFQLEGREPGVAIALQNQFGAIGRLLAQSGREGSLERAAQMLANAQDRERFFNLYEDAAFWLLKYSYLEEQGDRAAAREALTRALGNRDDYLPPETLVDALQRLFVLQAQTADLSAALETFERLQTSSMAKMAPVYDRVVATLEPSVREIRRVIAGQGTLELGARISSHGVWNHRLTRRAFAIADMQGNVARLSLRCARRNARYDTVSAGVTFEVPMSWGECRAYVEGAEGTTFKFYEFPGEGQPAGEAPPPAPATSAVIENDDASAVDFSVSPLLRIQPVYPPAALRRRLCGWVQIQFSIAETGRVENARAVDASDPVFIEAAVAAVAEWRYRPQVEDGRTVRREDVQTIIRFVLEGVTGPLCL